MWPEVIELKLIKSFKRKIYDDFIKTRNEIKNLMKVKMLYLINKLNLK